MTDNDCGTNMCPVCDVNNPQSTCTGVVGSAQPQQVGNIQITDNTNPVWKYGNKTLIPVVREYDKNTDCLGSNGLGITDAYGNCLPRTIGINNYRLTRKSKLVVGADEDSTQNGSLDSFSSGTYFELQTLHKVWGDGGGVYNKGVNSRNVYVGHQSENINYILNGNSYSKNQKVLYLEAHGDLYSGTVPGLKEGSLNNLYCLDQNNNSYQGTSENAKTACKTGDDPLYGCKAFIELTEKDGPNYNKRVGGCSATKDNFGSGVYNLLCYVPKTEDTTTDGRGYVFAIWPFHYEEIYPPLKGKSPPSQYVKAPCYNQCDVTLYAGETEGLPCPILGNSCVINSDCTGTGETCVNNPTDPGSKICFSSSNPANCSADDGDFSVINHEIDIEIPCNSPQFVDNWKDKMTWSTMNCNTWNNDINNYDDNTGAFYTQVAVQNQTGIFISSNPENSNNKDYHWYTIDWYVDPNDYTKNYVAFYFDDPFDPYETTTVNGIKLPKAPTNKPLHKTQRFVPTRGGRLNFGPWMAWWGYNGKKGGKPNFDTAKVRLAHLSIIPYQTQGLWDSNNHYYADFPQSFDQLHTNCDFRELFSLQTPKVTSSKLIMIISLILLGLLIIGAIVYFYLKHKRNKN